MNKTIVRIRRKIIVPKVHERAEIVRTVAPGACMRVCWCQSYNFQGNLGLSKQSSPINKCKTFICRSVGLSGVGVHDEVKVSVHPINIHHCQAPCASTASRTEQETFLMILFRFHLLGCSSP